MTEDARGRRRASPALTVSVAILVAAIAGLSIGLASQPDEADPITVEQQALTQAEEATIDGVRQDTANAGFTQGRKLGTVQGRRSGKAAGRADGRIQAQASLTRRAQSAAEAAQSALAEISEPPPTPTP